MLLLDDLTAEAADKTVHSVAHGVFRLEELAPAYGAERRRVRVIKYRGVKFRGGYHDFTITTGGAQRLSAAGGVGTSQQFRAQQGVERHRRARPLLGGGVETGSSTLILGPAGTGKSLLTIAFAVAAIKRGEKAALFVFDEELGLLFVAHEGPRHRPGGDAATAAISSSNRSMPPNCRPANSPIGSAGASMRTRSRPS